MTAPRQPRAAAPQVSETAWALLTDASLPEPPEKGGWELFWLRWAEKEGPSGRPCLKQLWAQHADDILRDWVRQWPGTRPTSWWKWSAPRMPEGLRPGADEDGTWPLPRDVVGGTGTPSYVVLPSLYPEFTIGIPNAWTDENEVEQHKGVRLGDGTVYAGIALDVADPPRIESQASYLKRHGLFMPGEERRLPADAFEPELVLPDAAAE